MEDSLVLSVPEWVLLASSLRLILEAGFHEYLEKMNISLYPGMLEPLLVLPIR